jgi:hypothetical protein
MLNLWLLLPLFTASVNGLDSSVLNGVDKLEIRLTDSSDPDFI